jgi:hypothetical protein
VGPDLARRLDPPGEWECSLVGAGAGTVRRA